VRGCSWLGLSCNECCKYVVVRSQPAARVAITQQPDDTDDENDDDDDYEDVEDDDDDRPDSSSQPSSMVNELAAGGEGSGDLSMIMEQSYMDADLNLCLSGMRVSKCRTT